MHRVVGRRKRNIERVGQINFESLSRNRMPANVTLLPAEDDVETGSPLSGGGFREEATGRISSK